MKATSGAARVAWCTEPDCRSLTTLAHLAVARRHARPRSWRDRDATNVHASGARSVGQLHRSCVRIAPAPAAPGAQSQLPGTRKSWGTERSCAADSMRARTRHDTVSSRVVGRTPSRPRLPEIISIAAIPETSLCASPARRRPAVDRLSPPRRARYVTDAACPARLQRHRLLPASSIATASIPTGTQLSASRLPYPITVSTTGTLDVELSSPAPGAARTRALFSSASAELDGNSVASLHTSPPVLAPNRDGLLIALGRYRLALPHTVAIRAEAVGQVQLQLRHAGRLGRHRPRAHVAAASLRLPGPASMPYAGDARGPSACLGGHGSASSHCWAWVAAAGRMIAQPASQPVQGAGSQSELHPQPGATAALVDCICAAGPPAGRRSM